MVASVIIVNGVFGIELALVQGDAGHARARVRCAPRALAPRAARGLTASSFSNAHQQNSLGGDAADSRRRRRCRAVTTCVGTTRLAASAARRVISTQVNVEADMTFAPDEF